MAREAAGSCPEQPESYQVRQENELQVLEAIYGQDFQDLQRDSPWKVVKREKLSFAGFCRL